MPLLGGTLVTLFSGLVAWLTQFITRKVAFGVAAVAAYATITGVLFIAFRAAIAALDGYATGAPAMFIDAMKMAVPPAAPFCLGTYATIWTAATVYTWQRDLLHLVAKV